ncbi:MAG: hypothetical protein WD716_10155 [Fimbriimonadaceae bacterium]
MSPTLRAFYGALVGAFIVLLVHPLSRPYLLQGVLVFGDSPFLRKTEMLSENIPTLPEPRTLEDASLWVVTALERDFSGRDLSGDDALLLVEVVQAAAERDPDNAYWRQSEAIFQRELGNDDAALRAWRTASLAGRWNDYQNERLAKVLEGLGGESHRHLAWHYGLVDTRKSSVVPRAVLSFARQTLRGDASGNFELRLATLRNGKLVRDGSKSTEGADFGVETIEVAAYSTITALHGYQGSGGSITPRALATARDDFVKLAATAEPRVGAEISEAFRDNDGRAAFINPVETEEHSKLLILLSVLTAGLPGALVTIGVIGAAIFIAGWLLGRSRFLQRFLTPPWTQVLGVGLGALVYWATRLFFPALWAAVSLGSFGIRRDEERQAVPSGMGPAYALTVALLAVGFSLLLAFYFVTRSLPGEYLLEPAGITTAFVLNEFAILSLATVVASLALVTASVWGFLARVPPERLAGPTVAKFGTIVCLGCFAAGVLLVPFAIGIDRSAGDSLSKIFQNEPTYYLTR